MRGLVVVTLKQPVSKNGEDITQPFVGTAHGHMVFCRNVQVSSADVCRHFAALKELS